MKLWKSLFLVAGLICTVPSHGAENNHAAVSDFIDENRNKLNGLFECLEKENGPQANVNSYIRLLENKGAAPLAKRIVNQQFKDLNKRIDKGFMDEYFFELGKGIPSKFGERPDALLDVAVKKFTNRRVSHDGFKCLIHYLNESPGNPDRLTRLKNLGISYWDDILNLGEKMQDKAENGVCDIVRPALIAQTENFLNDAITCKVGNSCLLLSKLEHEQVASRVFTNYFNIQLGKANTYYKTHSKFQPPSENEDKKTPLETLESTLETLNELHKEGVVPPNQLPEELRKTYVVEIFRAMGHRYMDSSYHAHGGYFVNQTVSVLQLSEGSIEKVASAICGLVPEVGAAICAVVEEVINAAWNFGVVPAIESKIKEELHTYVNLSMNNLKRRLENPLLELEPQSYCKGAKPDGEGLLGLTGFAIAASAQFTADAADRVLSKNLSVHLKEIIDSTQEYTGNVIGLSNRANELSN